jgi:hypothetical protein
MSTARGGAHRRAAGALFGALSMLLVACDGPDQRVERPIERGLARILAAPIAAAVELGSRRAEPTVVPPAPGCIAPSRSSNRPIDARDGGALERCESLRTGEAKRSLRCGEPAVRPVDPARLEASVPALRGPARTKLVALGRLGRERGLDPRSVGFVGDSITVSEDFLGPLSSSKRRGRVELAPWVTASLRLRTGGSVVDWFRGHAVERIDGRTLDAFAAFRAARVGARASWALPPERTFETSPLGELVRRLRPAFVVLTYGANDAAYRPAPPEELADEFGGHLERIVDALEERGVIVLISNEMRHLDQPGVKACPRDNWSTNDWRIAVAQNATNHRAAEVACERLLPFVDLRHALDEATNHGLGPDGVHLSAHRLGAGLLTDEGLDCGYNLRNFVTLLALRKLLDVLIEEGVVEPSSLEAPSSGPGRAQAPGG